MSGLLLPIALPGREFLEKAIVSTWLTVPRPGSTVPHLLIGHGAPRDTNEDWYTINCRLRGLANGLNLQPVAGRTIHIGPRLNVQPEHPTLDYGHPHLLLTLPATTMRWREQAARRGSVFITLSLEPLRPGMKQEEVENCLRHITQTQRAYCGITAVRGGQ